MKEMDTTIDAVKEKIKELFGESCEMILNKGRKKTETYYGEISETYPQVFIFKLKKASSSQMQISCSYTDVLCGNVKIKRVV